MYERRTPDLTTQRTTTASTTKSSTPIKHGTRQCTGRAPLTTTTNQQQRIDEQKEIQRRIAGRAATAMTQIRRRQPRSYMLWGDNRKAVIKRYPDGAQEIMVPQTLTPEQEQYEFPPRSRLLKKLATSTAERHRLSSLQYNNSAPPTVPPPPPFSNQEQPIVKTNVTNPHPTSAIELDQGALTEWFSGKQQRTAKDKAVMDWMSDVERSTSLMKKSNGSTIKNHLSFNPKKSSTSTNQATQNMHDINLHFKSEAGKLLSSGSLCQKSYNYLSPPNEDTKKHYVRLQRLRKHSNKPRKMTTSTIQTTRYQPYGSIPSSSLSNHQRRINEPSSSIFTTTTPRSTIPRPSPLPPPLPTSSSSSSKSSMVQLAQMFHKTLQEQQARAHKRMQQLESLLEEERHKRQNIQRTQQRTMSQLDIFMKKYQEQRHIPPSPILSTTTTTATTTTTSSSSPSPVSPAWVSILSSHSSSSSSSSSLFKKNRQMNLDKWVERITQLETRMQNEIKSRQTLQQTVVSTVQWMDGLKTSISTQALEHSLSQRQLEKRINEAFNKLSILVQQRKNG